MEDFVPPKRYHKPFRFMLLEKMMAEENQEPNFYPKYRKVLPPGLEVNQSTSMGVGNLTTQPVYPDENEVLNHDPLLVRHELKREKSADFVSQRSIDRYSRYRTEPELWQSYAPEINSKMRRPHTAAEQNYLTSLRRDKSMPVMYNERFEKDNDVIRLRSAMPERSLPGYGGYKTSFPQPVTKFQRSLYGYDFNDTRPIQNNRPGSNRTGVLSKTVTVLPPFNPYASGGKNSLGKYATTIRR